MTLDNQHLFNNNLKESDLERYDPETILNLINGNHDPNDRLPYSMLVNILRGKDYADSLLAFNKQDGDKTFIEMAHRFVILHVKVIQALCKHYDESTLLRSIED